jgi:hypothetical protein
MTSEGTPAAVIETLERVLEMARRGEIIAVAIAGLVPGGDTITSARWAKGQGAAVLGAAVLLGRDIAAELD